MARDRCRPLRAGDLAVVAAMEAAERGGWTLAQLEGELAQPVACGMVLANDGGGVLAYLLARRVLDELEILRLVVAPACRRQGFGRLLLGHVLDRARDAGARRCYLEVRAAGAPALGLYRGQGFVPCGLRRAYYADPVDDALLLQKNLHEVPR